ncbi:protein ERGIC-53-like isoform X2 [Rhinatrema bivittatum]|uniref:protein ERGIC-53-like isoform X2 n=1 Tax=Rhinatrema bivittatum TaxID=194408 RepID=UPI0011275CBF|nr:protein ERGIC-53-like isoform X2 [Rhinatrema bivittatum]
MGTCPSGATMEAVWYTQQRGTTGPVYGAADFWDGVGIFFDTFDNDTHRNNPIILVIGNNGKLIYDHPNDGASQALGSCIHNFRNTPHPFRARITYYKRTLSVSVNNAGVPDDGFYELCTQVQNMIIPSVGFFGVSAATGGLADDHDVMSFLTFSLTETIKEDLDSKISDSEKDKFEKEYEHFQKEFEKHKEEFQKEHPPVPTPGEELFESDGQWELDMISQGQRRILEELDLFSKRLTMASEEQKRHSELLGHTNKNENMTTVKGVQAADPLNALRSGQTELFQKLQEMRLYILKVSSKAKDLYPSTEGTTGSQSSIKEIKKNIDLMKWGLQSLVNHVEPGQKLTCPVVPMTSSCVSSSSFLFVLLIQIICAISYIVYRSNRTTNTKKFF